VAIGTLLALSNTGNGIAGAFIHKTNK